jgi:hypothetical protein
MTDWAPLAWVGAAAFVWWAMSRRSSGQPIVSRSYVSDNPAEINQQFERDSGRLLKRGYRILHHQWTGPTQLNVTYQLIDIPSEGES